MGRHTTQRSSARQPFSSVLLLAFTLLLLLATNHPCCHAKKKNRNAPHPHRSELTPYEPGPFHSLKLTAKDEAKLAKGDAVMKQIIPDDPTESGSAICVQDVRAPLPAVWYQILDLDNYKDKVGKLKEQKNYFVQKQSDGRYTIKTKQVLGVLPGYSYESYFDHTYHPQKSSLTWTLDYDKTSDFRDVAGHWHVASKTPEGQIEGAVTRVFYACDIRLAGHPPKAIVNYISKAALKQATAWVKRESEAHPDETIPAAYGGSKSGHAAAHADDREPELVGAGTTRRGFWKRRQ